MRLPYFSKYPYTNFEQLNIDFLLSTVSGFDARIKKNEEDINTLDGRVDGLEGRVDTAETDISDLKRRMGEAEADIDSLEDRMGTAEDTLSGAVDDISNLKDRMEGAEDALSTAILHISALDNRTDSIEDMIANQYDSNNSYHTGDYVIFSDTLYKCISDTSGDFDNSKWTVVNVTGELVEVASDIDDINSDITTLNGRVDDIPVVEANPGGTGTTLNTIEINNITYTIPSGGGGGGSSVTPNPSGTPTDSLTSVDIDGTIYDIPSTVEANPVDSSTTELTKLKVSGTTYSVQNLTVDNALDDTSSNPISNSAVTTAMENDKAVVGTVINGSLSGGSYLNYGGIREAGKIELTPGTWLINANIALVPISSGSYATTDNVVATFYALTDPTDLNTALAVKDIHYFNGSHRYSSNNIITVTENTTLYFAFTFGNSFGYCSKSDMGIQAIRLK